MLTVRKYWKEISLIIGLTLLYRDSFFSRFFQDDRILLDVSKNINFLAPIANFPYRPLAINLFYGPINYFFGENPFPYHFVLFILFVLGLIFVYKISRSFFVTAFIAFNLSLFPLFYWVAISYFVFVFFAFFACAYFYQQKRIIISFIFFLFGLLSNELAVVFPSLLFLLDRKRIWPFFVISLIYFPFRLLISPFPKVPDYQIDISLKFFATARWYLLRLFNLPEGIRGENYAIYFLFFILLLICLIGFIRQIRQIKIIFWAVAWFFIGALPFFFLPGHMSAYYLTLSLYGPAVVIEKIIKTKYLKTTFLLVYLVLSFFGLEYLKNTHWIILKPAP